MKRLTLTTVSVAALIAPLVPAYAQSAQATAGSDTATTDIIVTAQKRTENVQDVPKSVEVLSQTSLERAGASRLSDLPSVSVSLGQPGLGSGSQAPSIRGIASLATSIGVQSQTGIIVDDIPQSTFSSLASELADVQRVEVFPGPQSTLSGRNAAGGIVNFVTRNPTKDFAADVRFEQTTDRQSRVSAFVSAPLSDTLGFSLSGVYNEWAGPLRNMMQNGRAEDGFKTFLVRGKLRWEATDRLTATVTASYDKTTSITPVQAFGSIYVRGDTSASYVVDPFLNRTFATLYPGLNMHIGNRSTWSPESGHSQTSDKVATLRLDYDTPIGVVSYLGSYNENNRKAQGVVIGEPRTGLVVVVTDFSENTAVDGTYWTQELRLASSGNGPFTYLVGAIYTNSDLKQDLRRPGVFVADWDRTSTVKSAALFGRATIELTPNDAFTGGLRYQADKIGYTWKFNPIQPTDPDNFSQGNSNYDFLAGEASFKHDFSRDVNAYVTYSYSETGEAYDLESSPIAGDTVEIVNGVRTVVRPGEELTPLTSETVQAVEGGIKSQLFDRKLTLNASVFYARYHHFQLQNLVPPPSGVGLPVFQLRAVGDVTSKGVEVGAALSAIDNLTLSVSGAYTDTRITNNPDDPSVNGNYLPGSAKWKLVASAEYKIPLPAAPFDLNAGAFYRYQSATNSNVQNDPRTIQPGYGIVNIHAGASSKDGLYSLDLFVNNLFDKHYTIFMLSDYYANKTAIHGSYDRNSFRYAGIRLSAKFN